MSEGPTEHWDDPETESRYELRIERYRGRRIKWYRWTLHYNSGHHGELIGRANFCLTRWGAKREGAEAVRYHQVEQRKLKGFDKRRYIWEHRWREVER